MSIYNQLGQIHEIGISKSKKAHAKIRYAANNDNESKRFYDKMAGFPDCIIIKQIHHIK